MRFAILVSSDQFFDGIFQSALLKENSNGSYDVVRPISFGDFVTEELNEPKNCWCKKQLTICLKPFSNCLYGNQNTLYPHTIQKWQR